MRLQDQELAGGWKKFVGNRPANVGVSIAYNPHRPGTASAGERVLASGLCVPLPAANPADLDRVNRLPEVRHIPLGRIHQDLDRLHRTVDRALFGTRYHRLPEEERTSFVGFAEHVTSNLHLHLGWSVPDARIDEFTELAIEAWAVLGRPGSTIRLKLIRDGGWAEYLTKDVWGAALHGDPALFLSSRAARP